MVIRDRRASSGYDDESIKHPVEIEASFSFEDIEKDKSIFFMMYIPKDATVQGFVLFTDEEGQPILVIKETAKEIANKIAKKFMLLRPGSELFCKKG